MYGQIQKEMYTNSDTRTGRWPKPVQEGNELLDVGTDESTWGHNELKIKYGGWYVIR